MGAHPIHTGQLVRSSQFAATGLTALFLLFSLVGCRGPDRRALKARRLPPKVVSGYIDSERLLSLHPDASQLVELDRKIQRARQFPTSVVVQSLRSPDPLLLAAPVSPPENAPEPLEVDATRVRTSVAEDFAIRRRARPKEEEQRYRQALERLRRRFVELRQEPRAAEDQTDLQEALQNARRFSELEEQLRSLRERPEDRLFYNPAQLSRRRELFRLTEQELEALRQAEATRLEHSLDPTSNRIRGQSPQERQIPAEALARIERTREAQRQEALELLQKQEQSTIESAVSAKLPPPMVTSGAPEPNDLSTEELRVERETAANKVAQSQTRKVAPPSAAAATSATESLAALGKLREELRLRLLEEVRAAAKTVARNQGIKATFSPGAAPDRTAQIAPEVIRLLSGRVRSGAR